MYDELVKSLRICVTDGDCKECVEYVDGVECSGFFHLALEAADGIEELSVVNERQLLEIAVLSKPRWIPVTERLPEEHVFVLIRQDDDRIMVAERVDGDWWYRYFAYDVDRWDENEQGTITHWMPLPEPPLEE